MTRIPTWLLERHRLGELGAAPTDRVRAALAADAEAREHFDSLDADDARILAAHPPRVVAAVVRARLDREDDVGTREPRPWGMRALVPLASAVALAVGLYAWLPGPPTPAADGDIRLKGLEPSLLVFRQAPDGAEPLGPAATAHPDDVVQLAYQAAGRRYGVVVSIDGRGQVTRHLPRSGEQAARLQAGAPVPLADAYRLDDSPGFERFFLVTGDAPFSVAMVVSATERLYGGDADPGRTGTHLDLPGELSQFAFELRKESRR